MYEENEKVKFLEKKKKGRARSWEMSEKQILVKYGVVNGINYL